MLHCLYSPLQTRASPQVHNVQIFAPHPSSTVHSKLYFAMLGQACQRLLSPINDEQHQVKYNAYITFLVIKKT